MTTQTDLEEAVVIERTLDAPIAKVWRALTDVDQMRQWYLPCWREWDDKFNLKEFKPQAGFEFEFVVEQEGHSCHHLCKITEVIQEKKLAYSWRYKGEPGNSLVTFELSPEDQKTRLRLTHTGIETFPRRPAYARENFETGWTRLIGSELKQFVERKSQ